MLATAAAVSYAVDWNFEQARANQAYAVASRAQFEVRQLAALRRGDAEAVMSNLDSMLTSLTGQLANYEQDVPEELRHPLVYRSMAEVREYREAHSVHLEYPSMRADHEKALGLGTKVAAVVTSK